MKTWQAVAVGLFAGFSASLAMATVTVNGGTPASLNNTVYAPVLDAGSIGVLGAVESFAGSGSDAFKVSTNGARYHIGAGTNDYCSSDGTTVTFAGAVASGVSFTSNVQDGLLEKMGTSTTFLGPPLMLAVRTTPVGNVGVGEDTLQTVTLAANALTTTGHCSYYTFSGVLANNVNAKTINVYFGATIVLAITAPISLAAQFHGWLQACRTGASAQRTAAEAFFINTATNAVANVFSAESTAAETETNSIVLKLTGTATADNDIVENMSTYQIF